MNENAMNNSTGRELGWEDVIQQDSAGGLLPEGEYSFVITAVERMRHGGSAKLPPCNKVILTLGVADEAGNSGQLKHNLFLHTKCEGLLCAFFLAIGLRQHGEALRMRWDIIGRRGRCQISHRSYTGNDGVERKTNDIDRFLEPAAAPATPQSTPYNFPAFPPASAANTAGAQATQGVSQPTAPAYPRPAQPAPPAAEQTAMPLPRRNPWQTEA